MTVIVEFTLSTEDFVFGSALTPPADMDMDIELEAIVPTSSQLLPYFWVTGEEFERFERSVLSDSAVESVTQLDRIDETALYRIERSSQTDDLLNGLVETKAVVLEAVTRDEEWYFRVRFPTHNLLGEFYNFCTEQNISIHVERVYTLTDASQTGRIFDLTPEQREAIILAVQRGYFRVPRETTLSECVNNTCRTGKQWESRTKADNPSAGSPVESPDRGPQNQRSRHRTAAADRVDEPRQNPELAGEHYTDQDWFPSKHRREPPKLSK